MIVQCEKCETKFNVDEGRIKDGGSKVRCSQCKNIFMIYKPEAVEPEPRVEPLPEKEAAVPAPGGETVDGAAAAVGDAGALDSKATGTESGPLETQFSPESGDDGFSGLDDDSGSDFSPGPGESGDDDFGLDGVDFGGDDDLDLGSPSGPEAGGDDLGLDGVDFGGDDDLDLGSPSGPEAGGDDFGLGDADFGGGADPGPGTPSDSQAGGDDFGLDDMDFGGGDDDLDLGLPSDKESQDGDDFGLDDMDFGGGDDDLDLGLPSDKESQDGDDFGLDDMDFGGGANDQDLGLPQDKETADSGLDDMDFGGGDDDLDLGSPAAPGSADDAGDSGLDDMFDVGDDLDLGLPAGDTADKNGDAAGDDLDFGGFGEDLDFGAPGSDDAGDLDFTGLDGALPSDSGPGASGDSDLDGLDDGLGLGPDFGIGDGLEDMDTGAGLVSDVMGEDEGVKDNDQGRNREPSIDDLDDESFDSLDLGDEFGMSGHDTGMDFGSELEAASAKKADEELGDEEEDEELFPGEDEEAEELAGEFPQEKKKRGRGFLWLVVVLLLLIATAAGTVYFYPGLMDIFLGSEETVDKNDPMGNKGISPEDAKHSFHQNDTEGKLLVITGLARNLYDKSARSYIQIKGLLHDKNGTVLSEKHVYCGNILREDELTTLSYDEMMNRLKAKEGQDNSNVNVQPGQSVPFMIVFNNIPADISKYTIEILGSKKGELE